jgi:hypothetical protein
VLAPALRQRIRDFDPDLPVLQMQSMTYLAADSLWLKRLSATLIGLVAVLAIALADAGIYSVMSYSVSQRRKEVGIRIAFGADRRDVLRLIVGENLSTGDSRLRARVRRGLRSRPSRHSCCMPHARAGIEPVSGQPESGSIPQQRFVFVWHRNLRQLRPRAPRA